VFAVVFHAFTWRGQDRVGFAYPHESLGRGAAHGRFVQVWVMRFREGVEGSVYFNFV